MKHRAKYVKDIVIQDPDTGYDIDVTIFKHEAGGMFGIDSSYLDQVAEEDDQGNPMVPNPFDELEHAVNDVILLWPEEKLKKQ